MVLSQLLEMHRDTALSTTLCAAAHQDSMHKESQVRALLCQAGLLLTPSSSPTNSPGPVPAAGDGAPWGCTAPSQAVASSGTKKTCVGPPPTSSQGPVPPAAGTISLLSTQPCWRHRLEQTNLLPQSARGGLEGASEAPHTVAVAGRMLQWDIHSTAASAASSLPV